MRLSMLLFAALLPLAGQTAPETEAIAVVQRLFDALAAHDGDAIRSLMLPDARISVARDEAAPTSTAVADLAARLAADKTPLFERFTARPQVLIHGRIAQVWGEYEFRRDGKFSHCGVDSASLFRTPAGWKIAALAYTVQTTNCPGQ